MRIDSKDIAKRWTKGSGPGGQNRNKLETCCVLTHKPTGIEAIGDRRTRSQSYKVAYRGLVEKLQEAEEEERAARLKARRDKAIHNTERIRTYDYSRGIVTDHRTGKSASIKDVVVKGKLDLLK